MCAASASAMEEFTWCEERSREYTAAALLPCFAVHPQMPLLKLKSNSGQHGTLFMVSNELAVLENLAAQGRLSAVGETGFDLFNTEFRETEQIQEALFAGHIETALRYNLPLVLHVRRAMHKIFAYSQQLKKCTAIIFHSWSGTAAEGESLLRQGINAYFSFGTAIMLNHREAMRCCAHFPADRLLIETDAPYQPLRGAPYSSYTDLIRILEAASALRGEEPAVLEKIIESNFRKAFLIPNS